MSTQIKGNDTSTFGGNVDVPQIITDAPTFSYYQSSTQTLSSSTMTKLTFTSNNWDTTGGMFASSRFTPTIAGYYMISGGFEVNASSTPCIVRIYKNGAAFKGLSNTNPNATTSTYGSAMVYCNGSTDYVELYGFVGTGQALNSSANWRTYFQAHLMGAV